MKKNLLIAASALCVLWAAQTAECAATYTLDDCLEIASRGHPGVAGANASAAAAKGRLDQSAAADRLQIDGNVSATRSGSRLDESSSFSAGINASVKLYDANRNKYLIDASRASLSAYELDALYTLHEVREGVKSAFLTLLLSYETERQRSDAVNAFARRLEQARGFYEAGSKPWYDVTKAEVDLGNAQMSLVEASSNALNSRAALANAMGLDPSADFEIERRGLNLLSVSGGSINRAEALAAERPDFMASSLRADAGRHTLSAEARGNSPIISLSGGYAENGDGSFDFERGWNAGARMSVPIADGGAARAREDVARAQAASLESSREKLRQDIMLEVSRAKSDIVNASERIRISEITLRSAAENRKLAEGRYEAGAGSAIELTDALLSYTEAVLAAKKASYDLQIAIVNLERATGVEFGRE